MHQPAPKQEEDNQAQQPAHLAYPPGLKYFHRLNDLKGTLLLRQERKRRLLHNNLCRDPHIDKFLSFHALLLSACDRLTPFSIFLSKLYAFSEKVVVGRRYREPLATAFLAEI